jgi:hypothetical protein
MTIPPKLVRELVDPEGEARRDKASAMRAARKASVARIAQRAIDKAMGKQEACVVPFDPIARMRERFKKARENRQKQYPTKS